MIGRRLARGRGARAQSLVEFALVLPLFLLLLMGILDLGRGVAAYNSVANAARSAARVAIVNQNVDAVRQAAVDEAVGLTPLTVTFDPNVNGDDPCVITVCLVRVEVSYEYVPATPLIGAVVDTITVSSESQLPVERLHNESP
jgi:Flp pilus assembly protein TadG